MRLDKYLKVCRLFKRRTVAKGIADDERVFINNRQAKPSSDVKPGDEIKIIYGTKVLRLRVLLIADQAKKDDASKMYEIIDEIKTES